MVDIVCACHCGRPLRRYLNGHGEHVDGSTFTDACRPTAAEFRAALGELAVMLDRMSALAIPARVVGITGDFAGKVDDAGHPG